MLNYSDTDAGAVPETKRSLTAALRANSCCNWSIFSRICSASCQRQRSTTCHSRYTLYSVL